MTSAATATPSLLDEKLKLEVDVLRQIQTVLKLKEEYYIMKIKHLKNKSAHN